MDLPVVTLRDEWLFRLPPPFHIFRAVWNSDDLHFGLFDREDEPLLDAVRRMSEFLLGFLPETGARILDLGTGFGNTACRLAARGHHVTGIAPSEWLIEYAMNLARGKGLSERTSFHALPFEQAPWEFDPPFDVVFSQESFQYLRDLPMTFHHVHALTADRARLVISDQVLRDLSMRGCVQFHRSDEILRHARKAGFDLVHHEDLTARTRPTVTVTLRDLEVHRPQVLSLFRGHREFIEAEYRECLESGRLEKELYDRGAIGYELFVFEKR